MEGKSLDTSLVANHNNSPSSLLLHGRHNSLDQSNSAKCICFKYCLGLGNGVILKRASEKNVGCYHCKWSNANKTQMTGTARKNALVLLLIKYRKIPLISHPLITLPPPPPPPNQTHPPTPYTQTYKYKHTHARTHTHSAHAHLNWKNGLLS